MAYKVKTEHFEGPLDLLLSLIEEQKLDITRVSLAEITDEYLEHIKNRENISLANLADFLSVAAKLILIKSKALLPLLQLDDDEEADMHELERQLAALKVIKDAVPRLQTAVEVAKPLFARGSMWGVTARFMPPEGLTVSEVEKAFLASLNAIPQLDALEEKIISDVVSLEQKISHMQTVIAQRAEVAFSQTINDSENIAEVVVSFLALLELVKQQIIVARQSGAFDEIVMRAEEVRDATVGVPA